MKYFFLVVFTPLFNWIAGARPPVYQIMADAERRITVNARFPLFNDTLFMFTRGTTPQLPEGEAGFVRNLVVRSESGKEIPFRYAGEGNWILQEGRPGQPVHISYEILTTHTDYNWDHVGGVDEAAFMNADGLFFTGYTLFIVPGMELRDIQIEFLLPEGWKASTPWEKRGADLYQAESSRYLVNNCLMLGRHREDIMNIGGMEMRLAISHKISYALPLVKQAMQKLIPAYREMFGDVPASVYLVVMSEERMTDGSAFRRSFSQIFADTILANGMATWGYIMAHEIFHLWNGHAIVPEGQEEWFKEGVTDYMTNVLMRRAGLFPDAIMHRKLEHMTRRYWLDRFWQRDTLSIRETGSNKERFRFGVYGGGAVAAIALETEMRSATGNKKGMYDLMRALFGEFGKTGKRYTLDDIIRLVNQVTGTNLKPFFDRYVTGREFLDLRPCLSKMGLECITVIEEVYVAPAQDATEEQKEMYRRIFQD